jgi:DNA repair exonuclease SbcCD nuclease subunit
MSTKNMMRKGYLMTDIHFGKKSNSNIHNQDCLDYIGWFCKQVKNDPDADYVAFLGDWHENRTALDVSTQNYSYRGAKMLNDLGLPVYFIVGNHDLGMRDSRALYSTIPFHEFDNFTLIHDEPLIVPEIQDGCLFVPFLGHSEYPKLNNYKQIPVWMGHFEFKGFVLTGYNTKMEYGPDIKNFKDQKNILSGHFHRRQQSGNVTYIGNTFPMDFGDANLHERGLAIYDHTNHNISFLNWEDCPKYIKCKLSELLDDSVVLLDNSYVHVDVDVPVDYEELGIIEKAYTEKHKLREFKLDETSKFIDSLTDEEQAELDEDDGNKSTEELIVELLTQVDDDKFDSQLLQKLYKEAGMSNKDE